MEARQLSTQEVLHSTVGWKSHGHNFYHTMHYSAKRDLAITCRLSVRPSVTLVDHAHVG